MFFVVLIVFIILLLIMLSMIWPPDSPWAPWWRTNSKTARAVCKLGSINSKDFIIDLGCGDGEVLIQAAKLGARGVGIEIDPIRYLIAKVRGDINKVPQKIKFKRGNFFNEDISSASVIIVYLVPKTLEKLVPKFKKELKKGTRIVSFVYEIKGLEVKKIDKQNKLRLYVI